MSKPDVRRLKHVLEHIDRIESYSRKGRADLGEDPRTQDAVLYCLTVIGEALGALTPDTYRMLESLPPHLPKGQRNVIVHEYWRVDLDIVWATIEKDLPRLRDDIERAMRDSFAGS